MILINIIPSFKKVTIPSGPPDPPPDPGGGTDLATPYSFDALKSGQTMVVLSWTNNPDASSYEIQRKISGTFTTINSPAAGDTYYGDTGLTANTMYYYRFRSKGTGAFTDSAWVYRNDVTDDTTSAIAQVADLALDSKSATTTNRTNVATFMEALAAAGCDENIVCMYLLHIGANLSERMLNVICPENRDDAFRAVPVSSNAATDAKGVKNIAAGFFLDPKIFPNRIVERPMIWFSVYSQTAVGQLIYNGNAELNIIHFDPVTTPDRSVPNIGAGSTGPEFFGTNVAGHQFFQRDDWNVVRVVQNGTVKSTDSAQHIVEVTGNEGVSNYFSDNSPKLYTASAGTICSIYAIGHTMDSTKEAAFNAAVQQFAINEGFNV
jgi:hypothetical protein